MINLWIIEKKGKTIKAAVQSLKGYNCNVLTFMLRKQKTLLNMIFQQQFCGRRVVDGIYSIKE